MVCWATGGPQKYTGKSMRKSHEHLAITEPEWQIFLQDSLDKLQVSHVEQRESFTIVAGTKGDIVVP